MKENYIPGEGCECLAHSEAECGCDVDWTPREVYELREQRDRLLEEREQWRMSSVCRELREQRDRLAEALRDVMKYRKGEEPYDYWRLSENQRGNAQFDGWHEIEDRINEALVAVEGGQP